GEASLRVPGAALDQVLERLRRLSLASRELGAQFESARRIARQLHASRLELTEARRLIGPPRPWGAPAAAIACIERAVDQLAATTVRLDHLACHARCKSDAFQIASHQAHGEIATLRRTTMAHVFDKVRGSVDAAAARLGTSVRIEVRGDATPVDRHIAEALVDPIVQLARNAVVHGIERPEVRGAAGKPLRGRVSLSAEVRGAHLLIVVRDDGAGVNVERLCEQAKRLPDFEHKRALDDDALVHLLFTPGLTTYDDADLLAGRGLGLDLALRATRRLGGSIRLRNRPSRGLTATIIVPLSDRGIARVLWVQSGGLRLALPARLVLRVKCTDETQAPAPSLISHLDHRLRHSHERFVLQVGRPETAAAATISVAEVDGVGAAAVRPVPPLAAVAGLYVGVLVAPDGVPVLLVDALSLVDRSLAAEEGSCATGPVQACSTSPAPRGSAHSLPAEPDSRA
ncbi:MAG: ATP-binding protein, partial [Polyangiaceae bacterium]|nr:ATP-binding protein [Polyangiaceae bacterium]